MTKQRLYVITIEQTHVTLATAADQQLTIEELLEDNQFALAGKPGPYALNLSIQNQKIALELREKSGDLLHIIGLSMGPFRSVVRDYEHIRDSLNAAMRSPNLSAIEAIDMARRGIHNEGARLLRERLKGKAELDLATARHLFTLICSIWPNVASSVKKTAPKNVLFVCTMNAIRSPMAAAIAHHYFGDHIYAASAGVRAGDPDPFVSVVMDEINIDLKSHRPHGFGDGEELGFDLVITLSPEAASRAISLRQTEHWDIADPSGTQGSREQILDAYRAVRDDLVKKVKQRLL